METENETFQKDGNSSPSGQGGVRTTGEVREDKLLSSFASLSQIILIPGSGLNKRRPLVSLFQ